MSRYYLQMVGVVVLVLSLSCTRESYAADPSGRPNILFLFSDDHAIKAISAYGGPLAEVAPTPNIDRLAREGALFQNNFCANSICAPSRASILTGKHSHMNGQMSNFDAFDGAQQTFPKLLQKAGYTTAIFGKWHLKSNPTGFDQWMVLEGQGTYYAPDFYTPTGKVTTTGYSTEIITDLTLDYLKKSKDSGKPFMVMCQYKAPHRNWMPAPAYLHEFDDVTFSEPETLFDDYKGRAPPASRHRLGIDKHMTLYYDLKVAERPAKYRRLMHRLMSRMTADERAAWDAAYGPKNKAFLEANLSGKELVRWKYQRYIKDYLRCVTAVDDNIGRILDYLDETGLEKNTIVVYSSDQGFFLGEHGWYDKRWMYEESFRMPLVMRWPETITPGTKVEQLTQNIDFGPTFLEAAGIDIPKDMQGESLFPVLAGETAEWRRSLYYHYYEERHGVPPHEGVRTDRHKLIRYYTTDEWELFDLVKDPQEMTSVYENLDYAETRNKLAAELERLRHLYNVPKISKNN